MHSANGLLMTDSLQTGRLRLNAVTQSKMDRLVGTLGVDVIDELGCVSGELLHADALRKTYGRCQRYDLDSTMYMQPSETWGSRASQDLVGRLLPAATGACLSVFAGSCIWAILRAPAGPQASLGHGVRRELRADATVKEEATWAEDMTQQEPAHNP